MPYVTSKTPRESVHFEAMQKLLDHRSRQGTFPNHNDPILGASLTPLLGECEVNALQEPTAAGS